VCKGATPLVEQKEVDGGPGLVTLALTSFSDRTINQVDIAVLLMI
jgi:hypothetical protein